MAAVARRSQTAIAKSLGVEQSSVSGWCRGVARPEPHFRRALCLLEGIPEDAWLLREERSLIRRVERQTVKEGADAR